MQSLEYKASIDLSKNVRQAYSYVTVFQNNIAEIIKVNIFCRNLWWIFKKQKSKASIKNQEGNS